MSKSIFLSEVAVSQSGTPTKQPWWNWWSLPEMLPSCVPATVINPAGPQSDPWADHLRDRLEHPELVDPAYRHLIPDDRARVEAIVSIPVSGVVLDVGSADGVIADLIEQRWGVSTYRTDKHPNSLRALSWDVTEPFPWLDIVDQVDAVYVCEVLEHLTQKDGEKARQNILEVLKPGGLLVASVPNRFPHERYLVSCRDRWRWPDHRNSWDKHGFHFFWHPQVTNLNYVDIYPEDSKEHNGIWLILTGTKA